MFFQPVPSVAATPDPIASPELVPDSNVVQVPETLPNSNAPVRRLALASSSPTAALTVDVYALIENTSEPQLGGQQQLAPDRQWRLLGQIVGAAGQVVVSTFDIHRGRTYIRITAGGAVDTKALLGWVA